MTDNASLAVADISATLEPVNSLPSNLETCEFCNTLDKEDLLSDNSLSIKYKFYLCEYHKKLHVQYDKLDKNSSEELVENVAKTNDSLLSHLHESKVEEILPVKEQQSSNTNINSPQQQRLADIEIKDDTHRNCEHLKTVCLCELPSNTKRKLQEESKNGESLFLENRERHELETASATIPTDDNLDIDLLNMRSVGNSNITNNSRLSSGTCNNREDNLGATNISNVGNVMSVRNISESRVINTSDQIEQTCNEISESEKDGACTDIQQDETEEHTVCRDVEQDETDHTVCRDREHDETEECTVCRDGEQDETEEQTFCTDYQKDKVCRIRALLRDPLVDMAALQAIAAEDEGFVTDAVRRLVWPRLLHVQDVAPIPLLTRAQAAENRYCSQVVMDVERTLKRFPPGISSARRTVLMDELIRVIVTVLERNPDMHYYQGYHDVGITFLLVCGESAAVVLLEELSLTHLREFLQPTMERTQRWLAFLYPILRAECPALHSHVVQSGVGTVFCLAWLITWYAHTLSQYRQVVRLYDFLLASPPMMPMYVAGAILRHREQELLAVECDMAMMHHALSKVPDDLPLDALLQEARLLYRRLPPPTLAEEVDRIMEERKQQEAIEQQVRERRLQAARARRAPQSWVARAITTVRALPWEVYSVRGAGAVAVLAVLVSAVLYRSYGGDFRRLQLAW